MNLEQAARQLAERVARGSILGDPTRHAVYAADCAADGKAVVPMYDEADIAHYVETRWQDFAHLLEKGRAALIKAGVELVPYGDEP